MKKLLTALSFTAVLAAGIGAAHARTVVDVGIGAPPVVVAPAPVIVAAPAPGPYCRQYRQTLTIAGETQVGYGTACLQPDGSWELMTPASGPGFHYIYRGNRIFFLPPHPFASVVIRSGPHHGHGRGW
jgi:hypothetical protein